MLHVVAVLSVIDRAKLTLFESQAMAILKRHGGELVVAFTSATEQGEREVHHLCFPDSEAFQAYRDDPELTSLASLREEAISDTEVYVSESVLDYQPD